MVKKIKSLAKQSAFTLIELIITLLILAIVSVYVQSKFSSTDRYKEDSVIAQIISSARLTQQLTMNDSARNFSLVIQSNQIDLQIDGSSLSIGSMQFPIMIDNTITLSPASTVIFDQLGTTTNFVLIVMAETTQRVCFETSGYIHLC